MSRFVNNRRDGNHAVIVAALERSGCRVADLSEAGAGVPDLFVYRVLANGEAVWRFMELKTARGRMRKAQQLFADKFPVSIVRSPREALLAMGIEVAACT